VPGGHTEAAGGEAEELLVPGQVGLAVGDEHHGGVREVSEGLYCSVILFMEERKSTSEG
jgi:hypothetical protein